MAFHLELKKMRSKEQHSSKIVKEMFDLPQLFGSGLRSPAGSPSHRVRQDADGETFVRPTRSSRRQRSKRRANKSDADELVKHMTNVPHYLLHADREENTQDNPLNFGVLDWTQLEKWKHNQRHRPAKSCNFTSFRDGESSSRNATKSSAATAFGTFNRQGLYEGAKPYVHNARRSQHFETEEKRKDLDKSVSGVRTFASYLREDGVSLVSRENKYGRYSEDEKSTGSLQESSLKKKEKNREVGSDMGLRSSKFKSKGVCAGSKKNGSSRSNKLKIKNEELQESDIDVMGSVDAKHKQGHVKPNNIVLLRPRQISSSSNRTEMKDDELQDPDTDYNHKQGHRKPKNIVLLRPRPIPQSSSNTFELSGRRTSFDEFFAESSRSSPSNVSLYEDINAEGSRSEIPHSSEQCSMAQPVPTLGSLLLRTETDQGTDCSSVASETPSFASKSSSLHSEDAYFEMDALSDKLTNHSDGASFERDGLSDKMTNQYDFSDLKETLDHEAAELTAKRGRNLSSSRRFSFSLNRIGRSFSFKEGSTLPQLSSTYASAKSGPVTSSFSARWYSSSKEKENGHDRSRSSPLRRLLLDPILKRKASKIRNSAEISQVQKGSLDSISCRTTSVSESLPDEMREGSLIQAHLQVTIKNGLPFFKFVLNNDAGILAAAMKSLESSDKDDLNCYFTFYQLNEIKKKSSGWKSHGSKEKGCDYAYNAVGQMRFSSSTITKPSNQDSKTLSVQKEYVLLSVEIDQTDQGPPEVIRRGELAAAVVEIPFESLIHKGLHWDNSLVKGCLKCSAEERCMCNSGENDISGSTTTVILPGGIHGSSERGEPSPLIHRWKSGGLCDCGGWDIGCKLLVLSNPKLSSKSQRECFQLFVQEGAEQDSPAFIVVPLKEGLYSVEFNSSITHLQAFFISVAALSCQKLSSLEMSIMQEQIFKEPGSLKSSNNLPGNAPVNYTPIPPPSPAGRV